MSSRAEEKPKSNLAELGFDRSEPQISSVVGTTIGIIGVLVGTGVGVQYYYEQYRERIIEERQLAPVSQDLLDLRSKEEKELGSYGYADKANGVVRVPVSRAMELVISEAKEGKSKYPTAAYIVKKAEDAATPAAPAAGAPAK
ncbi:MAG: hypothetical protein FJW38_02085 [Acidobacteria bacterium]|nr:hypothetical protein [Acidobacteriota bacterium]MBM3764323.1 hypothetical protein [Acidobacteriota bacterium]